MSKTYIPKAVRNAVWNKYIGTELAKAPCFVGCGEEISFFNFECGHVISDKYGGNVSIANLRPICGTCNKSMRCNNLNEFILKYGFDRPYIYKDIELNVEENKIDSVHGFISYRLSKLYGEQIIVNKIIKDTDCCYAILSNKHCPFKNCEHSSPKCYVHINTKGMIIRCRSLECFGKSIPNKRVGINKLDLQYLFSKFLKLDFYIDTHIPIEVFVEKYIKKNEHGFIIWTNLFSKFYIWYTKNYENTDVFNKKKIKEYLEKNVFKKKCKVYQKNHFNNKKSFRGWVGFKLID